MFTYNSNIFINPSIFSSIPYIFGVVNSFLQNPLYRFLYSDKNLIVPLFFGWKMWGMPTLFYLTFKLTLKYVWAKCFLFVRYEANFF